jgi:hypothetical protein
MSWNYADSNLINSCLLTGNDQNISNSLFVYDQISLIQRRTNFF